MGVNPGSPAFRMPPAEDDQLRKARDAERSAREGAAARTAEATTIGKGGIRVKDGGSITVESPGTIDLSGGAFSASTLTATTTVTAGTNVTAGGTVQGAAVVSTGNVTASGGVTASGQVYSGGILRSPGSRAYNVVAAGGYVGAWMDVNGNIGFNPSGVEFKQDFEPADLRPVVDAILHIGLIRYRSIEDVEAHGENAPYYLGTIAQYMAAGPLGEWVVETDSGAIINWEQIGIPLVAAIQHVWTEHLKVRADTDAILAHLGLNTTA